VPVVCPRCARALVIGSLRCARCGADARGARPHPAPRLSLADAIGHESLEAHALRVMGWRWLRRQKLVDALRGFAPAYLAWARLPARTRGPAPRLPGCAGALARALLTEYRVLL